MENADFNIDYTARLARIELTESERKEYGSQLADILRYVKKLQELNVEGVEPTAHPAPLRNVFRPDVTAPSLSTEEALKNAPRRDGRLFRTPKIVE